MLVVAGGKVKGHDRQQGSDIPETPGNPEGNHSLLTLLLVSK